MQSKKTILDIFCQIKSEKQAEKPDLCIRLWNHLSLSTQETCEVDENDIPKEVTYTLRRLIQGLGSPRAPIRNGYFTTLIILLSKFNFSSGNISLAYFKDLIDKQLSKYESKGEEGEILTGRILAYGVAMRSKLFLNGSVELQREIISDMLSKSKERSYLPSLAYSFITDFIRSVDEERFKIVVWPALLNEVIIPWTSQTFDTLYCLLEIQNKYPSILEKKLILSSFRTACVLDEATIQYVQTMLTNITWEPIVKHPLYEVIGQALIQKDDDFQLLKLFWTSIEGSLSQTPTRLKSSAVFTLFSSIIRTLDLGQIPELLTTNFVAILINSSRSSTGKNDKSCAVARSTLQLIVSRVTDKSATNPAAVYHVLYKLLFESGHILIDKLTGVRIVFPCVAKLDGKHVKLFAKKCESVALLKFRQKEGHSKAQWNFKDRSYACQMLARLISHPENQDMDWKIRHLKVMVKYALFIWDCNTKEHMSDELAVVLRNAFFTAMSHQFSHLENHRMVLISLVYFIDNLLTTGEYKLRSKASDKMINCWKNTLSKVQKVDLKIIKTNKRKTVMYIFHTLFLQMALHLFVDPVVAENILNELDRCYKKEKMQYKKNNSSSIDAEPEWIEITVAMLLSLLSNDTYLLRQLISRIFPHLCPHLTAQATFQILQVFDPTANKDILTENDDSNDESEESSDEENIISNSISQINSVQGDVEEESDSEIEDIDDMEETAIEKTRQAVRDALGMAGSVTDTESIDLDDIDEEEGRKLDLALSQAFKNAQKTSNSRNKKQSPNDRALTNFRIRVLDLVDIYLDNNPSFSLVLDTIPILFKLLEFTIKDSHQQPLENRIRSTIKKIGHLKKSSGVAEVDTELQINVLKNLIEKGVRSTPVFLDLCNEMSECCTFLVRMHVHSGNNSVLQNSPFYDVFVAAIENFFVKRDCLLPVSLFENILGKTNWAENLKLCERIAILSFDANVRGFRKNQGLSLLSCFYRNSRLLSTLKEHNYGARCTKLEDLILENASKILYAKNGKVQNVKTNFISELCSLLCTIKSNKYLDNSKEWVNFSKSLQSNLTNGSISSSLSRKYIVKLCNVLHIKPVNKKTNGPEKKLSEGSIPMLNGYVVDDPNNSNKMEDNESEDKGIVNDVNSANSINIVKKKKSKRKGRITDEKVHAKRLRYEIANGPL